MRISTWFCLAATCSIVLGVAASVAPLSARPFTPPPLKTKDVKGIGLTPKDAETDALERACDLLATDYHLGWTPTPDFLHERKMFRFGEMTEKKSDIAKEFGGRVYVVQMTLEINGEQERELRHLARQQRMKERQKESLFFLIGAACLIGVVGGYLRLEEATKGYYTRLLRIAAVSIVSLVAAGLWFLR
jgi:hypothetical protein